MARTQLHTALYILAVTALILVIMLLHTDVYGGRNYREDEINSVHAAMIKTPSEIVQWMATDVHPPGWRLLAKLWVDLFGGVEEITRWSSKLLNLLTFALLYQLGKHVVDKRTAIFAVAILGVYGFASNGMNELRPYPLLITLTTALHLVFYRWMHQPTKRLMLVYAALGIAAIYTHFFAFFIFPAHALFLVIFRKFDHKVWFDSVLMWLFIGLSFSAWILPLLFVILIPFPGGIYYAIPEGVIGLELLYQRTQFTPNIIQNFLLILSLFTSTLFIVTTPRLRPHLRFYNHWKLLYPLLLLGVTLLVAYLTNSVVSSLTARNLLMMVMLVSLLIALGLRLLPVQAGVILIILLYLGAPQAISVQTSNGPYREIVQSMSDTYQPDNVLVTEFSSAWRWLMPAAYYLMDFTPDHLSKQRMFHIINEDDTAHPPAFPDKLVNIAKIFTADDFSNNLPQHQQLWLLQQGGGNSHNESIQNWLQQHYAFIDSQNWSDGFPTSYTLSEYVRAPDNTDLILRSDANYELHAWSLQESVDITPCQTITIESWWQTQQASQNPDELVLILADDNGQVAISEKTPADVFTTNWIADTFYRDHNTLTIPCDIETGSYNLLLGMKDSITGDSLALTYPDGNDIGTLYYLTTLNTQGN